MADFQTLVKHTDVDLKTPASKNKNSKIHRTY